MISHDLRSVFTGTLGAGLVEIPPVPYRDPVSAVLADPVVPEHRRFCGRCDAPVGRARDGRPGRVRGYCSGCGTRFSFEPALRPGEVVAAQYEVVGCLAHGGTGWVHLARDREVSGRFVVLKGMIGSGDPDLPAVAEAERRHLAAVDHPAIVRIYNVVRHFGAEYIVMEYVGGRSLKEIVLERRRAGESPPLTHVLAYGLEALRALDHLHGLGLLYCDFKPDNAIHSGDALRLIDLGGVRRADDPDGPVYGTVGYQAPEIAQQGPSVGSDLYTVARAMAVLSFEFTGFTGRYAESLPERERVAVLARHESYDRLLRRAAHPDPAERFTSAAEMAEQLIGVLREVLASEDGRPRPSVSARFTGVADLPTAARPWAAEVAEGLPAPVLDDPNADGGRRVREAGARIEAGDHEAARVVLEGGPKDWWTHWYLGICALARGEVDEAARHFDRVYALLPGEAAPQLALGLCAELRGDHRAAARHLLRVWRTDRRWEGAAFGLARARLALGDRKGAGEVLASVPASSPAHADAQVAAIVAALAGRDPADVTHRELARAAGRLERLDLEPERRARLTVLILETALEQQVAHAQAGPPLLGTPRTERDLRRGLERGYRSLARLAGMRRERVRLVELANSVRPKTLL
ncbi:tetratricopeptide repeat protein [Actinomadura sp. SCN-SB]|uniref:serine/threonine-protein kinase n=1 Tax=Actinomadura sp. SCN-SB TaxID=3373092 RepID=UPI0037511D4C